MLPFRFSQNFIDIREKEKKRGARGLITVPQKYPDSMLRGSDAAATTEDGAAPTTPAPDTFIADDLLDLQEKITKEILKSKLQENERQDLQASINRELLNSKVFSMDNQQQRKDGKRGPLGRMKNGASSKARSLMNLHNNEAGRRVII